MKKQSGFGLVETILVLLILAAVGFGGYAVWHKHPKTAKVATQVAGEPTVKSGQTCSGPAASYKGISYLSNDGNFSFCEPDGWQLGASSDNTGLVMLADNVNYKPGIKPTVFETGGKDGPFVFAIFYSNNNTPSDLADYNLRLKDYTKEGAIQATNISGYSYYHLTGDKDVVGAGLDYLTKGTKQYVYYFQKNKKVVQINYNAEPNMVNNNSLVGEFVQSIGIK